MLCWAVLTSCRPKSLILLFFYSFVTFLPRALSPFLRSFPLASLSASWSTGHILSFLLVVVVSSSPSRPASQGLDLRAPFRHVPAFDPSYFTAPSYFILFPSSLLACRESCTAAVRLRLCRSTMARRRRKKRKKGVRGFTPGFNTLGSWLGR